MPATSVLVIEDRQEDRAFIDAALRDQGYLLLQAAGAEDAARVIVEQEVQIVLLSTALSGADALGLAAKLRGLHRLPFQFILVSSANDLADVAKSLESGCDDFIHKPLDVRELQARVRSAEARWRNQATLMKEREFYRIAVAEEERLSSLVLDQNQSLKEAFEKIQALNEELERANRELELIATYDSLSGLLNRRSLFSRLEVEIERSKRLEIPLAGVMVDIDKFKGINDSYGHQCGDMVIREIGARLNSGLRKYDYAGRYGGEEFFIVLSNSTSEQALTISERFRRDMEKASFSCNGETLRVTVSVGLSCYRAGESCETWIDRADQAMYQAKQAGRNRVVAA